ncbi:GLPGLI family protein [Spirosoma endbachense]|uniref:GLPGLI family protein n=1 Tax=Spirosoma endbachense TaxID=2666025 RepID=A0A6P1W6F1_9BACT|nr:GLPGLI family protein [Spirosoma endbachense]QHV99510.1 GLPGLI family protein [Spirosoma endbachense]
MKAQIITLLAAGLLISIRTTAQTATPDKYASGKITYEGMRQIDRSQMRTVINGQEVRPGSAGAPDAPEGMPEVMSFTQKLVFSGTMAKEERDRPQNMMMRRNREGDGSGNAGGPPRNMRMTPPFEQQTYLDLGNRKRIDVLTVKKDSTSQTTYRSENPMPTASDWQASDKTKKIAGFTCHKATATRRKQTYTIWYTTDLPFTYSPVSDLTPPTGVVLQIESDNESYKASSISTEAIAASAVQPPADAKSITSEEMEQMRRKSMADFRQRMMSSMPGTGRN